MNMKNMRKVLEEIKFPGYKFKVLKSSHGFIYLRGEYDEADTITGKIERQLTRRWLLSPSMTKSEIVQTVFKCALTSMEHKTREWFTYKGRSIYGPHQNVDTLYEACENLDMREV